MARYMVCVGLSGTAGSLLADGNFPAFAFMVLAAAASYIDASDKRDR